MAVFQFFYALSWEKNKKFRFIGSLMTLKVVFKSLYMGHPFRPVKNLSSFFWPVKLASYFMQMRFEVIDLKF